MHAKLHAHIYGVTVSFLKDAKNKAADTRAQRAIDEGRTILFITQKHSTSGWDLSGDAEVIEATEALGWRLERMSHFMDTGGVNKTAGVYQFRRDPV